MSELSGTSNVLCQFLNTQHFDVGSTHPHEQKKGLGYMIRDFLHTRTYILYVGWEGEWECPL